MTDTLVKNIYTSIIFFSFIKQREFGIRIGRKGFTSFRFNKHTKS